MKILILVAMAVLVWSSGVSAAPAEGHGNITVHDGYYAAEVSVATSLDNPISIRRLAAREEPYPQWLKDLLAGGLARGWFNQQPQIIESTLTAQPAGPAPTQLVTDTSPPPPRNPRMAKRDNTDTGGKEAIALNKRQTLSLAEQKLFQLEVFKLYIDKLARTGNNLTALCRGINMTALEQDGIEGEAASSYICAKATAPVTSTTASLSVDPAELATLPVPTTIVTSVPTLTANASFTAAATAEIETLAALPTTTASTLTESTSSPTPTAAYYRGYHPKRSEPGIEAMAAYLCDNVPYEVFVDVGLQDRYEELRRSMSA